MSDEIDDGGQVYACANQDGHQPGITRRDWLAGLAMQGILSNNDAVETLVYENGTLMDSMGKISRASYLMADTMIKEGRSVVFEDDEGETLTPPSD
jgi:hypothetical protein